MRRKAPSVREYMTHLPVEAERCATVADAEQAMTAKHIRHIPVMNGARLKGLVSRSDVLAARVEHGDAVNALALEEICQMEVLTVPPTARVDEVAEQMLERRVGSAVVMDGGFVVGIFTSTDALRFVSDWFGESES